jgi:hypothetical protein
MAAGAAAIGILAASPVNVLISDMGQDYTPTGPLTPD